MPELFDSAWEFRAISPGKTVVILGGVHGNEQTGIEVVRTLHALFSSGEKTVSAGCLQLALGNLDAIRANVRGVNGKDLNRLFSDRRLSLPPDGTPEDTRVRLLAPLLTHADVLLDIHATNKPSVPFFAGADSERHFEVYRCFRADRILSDPKHVLGGEPVTTDEYVDLHGGVGMCYETGSAADMSRVGEVLEDVLMCLRQFGVLQDGMPLVTQSSPKNVYELTGRIVLDARGFRFAEGKGNGSFEEVRQGEAIGFVGEDPVVAAEDCVLLFPKIKEHWRVGEPVVYFAKRTR